MINGLAILCRQPCSGRPRFENLEAEYADKIIGGPGAFVVTADGEQSFAQAVRRKLILEIADLGWTRTRRLRGGLRVQAGSRWRMFGRPAECRWGAEAEMLRGLMLLLALALALPARAQDARAGRPGAVAAGGRDELDRRRSRWRSSGAAMPRR